MQGLLEKKNKEVKTITSYNKETTEDLKKRKVVLSELQGQVVSHETLVEQLLGQIDEFEGKKLRIQNEIKVAKKTLREKTDEFLTVQADSKRIKQSIEDSSRTHNDQVKHLSEDLAKKKIKAEETLLNLDKSIKVEETTLEDLEEFGKTTAHKLQNLNLQREDAEKAIEASKTEHRNLCILINSTEKEQTIAQKKLDNLLSLISQKENEYQTLEVDVSSLKEEKSEAKLSLEKVQSELKASEGKLLKIGQREDRLKVLENHILGLYKKAGVEVDI